MSFIDQLTTSIEGRIDEVTHEITALEAALAALQDEPASPAAPRRAPAATRRRRATAPSAGRPAAPVAALFAGSDATPAPDLDSVAPDGAIPLPDVAIPASDGPVAASDAVSAPGGVAAAEAPISAGGADPLPAVDPAETESAPGPPARPAPPASRNGGEAAGRRPRRRLQELSVERLEQMLGEHADGLSAISIAKQAGADYNQVRALLRRLEESGDVRRTGNRKTSLWRLVTDEERIAERAAELAARSGA